MHWRSNISLKHIFLKRWYSHVSWLIHRMFTSEMNVYHKLLILQDIGNVSYKLYLCTVFSKHFTQVSLKGRDLEVLKWTFGVVFIGRLHFTTKFFVTSTSDKFIFSSNFEFALVFTFSHWFSPSLASLF